MIRRIGRKALLALAGMIAKAREPLAGPNEVVATYTGMAKSLEAGGTFVYQNLNPHGCPWPGRAAARARHHAGSGRRPK